MLLRIPLCALIVLLLTITSITHAATNDLTTLLQRGLFEEEANRNLDAAISNYKSLANDFDKDRQLAATAIFRLGECYRKLGRTNEAVAQYQRLIREFSDQQTLTTLSQQNLAGLGATPQRTTQPASEAQAASGSLQELQTLLTKEKANYDQRQNLLDTLKKMSRDDLKKALPTVVPDNQLNNLLSELDLAQQNLLQLKLSYGETHPKYIKAKELVEDLNRKIDDRIDGIMVGLQTLVDSSNAQVQSLKERIAEQSGGTQTASEQPPITDEEEKEIRRIQQLIQNSPDLINAPSGGLNGNQTPLYGAAISGWLRVASFLLDHGADPNADSPEEGKPLIGAAGSGNRAMVELLLARGANVNANEPSPALHPGETALHSASERGFLSVAEVLLNHKADVNSRDGLGDTPLHLAAAYGRVEIIKLLLAHGADVNAKDKDNATPLTGAASNNHIEAVSALLAAKPDVDVIDGLGETPLSVAARNGYNDIAKTLLQSKADPNVGTTNLPLAAAIEINRSTDKTSLCEMLLRAGADPNQIARLKQGIRYPNDFSASPLQLAINRRETDTVKLLLDYKADANAIVGPQTGETALMNAASDGNTEIAKALLEHGANVNATTPTGATPLFYSVWNGSLELAELLISNNANVNVQTPEGRTPLAYAKQVQKENIVTLLRQHGALDTLPNWNAIEIVRSSTSFSAVVFRKGTNDANQFSLLELLAVQYQFLASSPGGGTGGRDQENLLAMNDHRFGALSFPDLFHIRIRRPDASGRNWNEQTIDVKQILESGACSNDVQLKWGDQVEIPETDHPLNERWSGFTGNSMKTFQSCLTRQIQIAVKGETHSLTLQPAFEFFTGAPPDVTTTKPFWILPVLRESNLLLASSDLSQIKVKRHDASGKTREWTVDCLDPNSPPNFWLRDGDVIDVPEKPE